MSEQDELERLQRQLDAAFAHTRPRRGFEDELWARLQPQRRRPLAWLPRALPWAAGGAVAVLVAGVVVGGALLSWGGGAESGTTASRSSESAQFGPGASGTPTPAAGAAAAPGISADLAGLAFGRLPAPEGAGVPHRLAGGSASPLPVPDARVVVQATSPPAPGPTLTVYRYKPGSGPPAGALLAVDAIPPGMEAAPYPSRPPAEAVSQATAGRLSGGGAAGDLTLTEARLVYVAVVSDGRGYLEPAYLYTGTLRSGGTPTGGLLLVSAVAAPAIR